MKLISWNVNGIRAVLKKGFLAFIQKHDPDVLCLQETKAMQGQAVIDLPQYEEFWNSAKRKGYSGTAVFTKVKPRAVVFGIGEEADDEGRVITLELDEYFIVCCYTPNVKHDLSRLAYRQQWDRSFLRHLKRLEKRKPVLACGDFNVAHKEIDLARPKQNRGNAGFTDEERESFDAFIKAGFIDTFRLFTQEGGHYSWWSYRANARANNVGWRIDYVLASKALKERIVDAFILPEVYGSDHCPVGVLVK